MARRAAEIGMVLALVALLAGYAQAQSSCMTALVSLAPCLSYITGNSTVPSTSCCSQLASVVQSQPQCLCLVLSSGASSSLGIPINATQALALPGACNVQTPPVSKCNAGAGGPTASPSSPTTPSTPSSQSGTPSSPSSPSTPSFTDTPADGSKTTPSTDGQSSDGNSGKTTQSLMASLLFVAACFSAITSF